MLLLDFISIGFSVTFHGIEIPKDVDPSLVKETIISQLRTQLCESAEKNGFIINGNRNVVNLSVEGKELLLIVYEEVIKREAEIKRLRERIEELEKTHPEK